MKQVTAAASFLLRKITPTRGRHRTRRQAPAPYRATLLDELLGGDE